MSVDQIAERGREIREALAGIVSLAHVNTFHPGAFDWSCAATAAEKEFTSVAVFGEPGHERAAEAYVVKELALLAEVERHVSSVMGVIASELHSRPDAVNRGHELNFALSCFAAEEFQHSNTFHRYVRAISGFDPLVDDTYFADRMQVFGGDENPYVKLVALCGSAYVGESVMTVFEHRLNALDPVGHRFLTRLVRTHGLDEARHVAIDHVAMKLIYPALSDQDRASVRDLMGRIEALNTQMAMKFIAMVTARYGFDFHEGNPAAATQLRMTQEFAARIIGPDGELRSVDEILDDELSGLLDDFCGRTNVHPVSTVAPAFGVTV